MRVESIPEEKTRQPLRRLFLLYHEVRANESRYSYVLDTGLFERHMDLFVLLSAAQDCEIWPELTFDDGHSSDVEIAAPLLQTRGLTARFFITAGWTGTKTGYMGWADVRSLHEAGFPIGAHGWSHKLLTHCGDRELQTELSRSRLTLEEKLGAPVSTMSLPGGRCNRRVLAACAAAGYTQVYTSVPQVELLPLGATVGRLNILGSMQPEWIATLFEPDGRALSKLERNYRMKEAAKKLMGDRLYARLWALVNRREPESGEGAE